MDLIKHSNETNDKRGVKEKEKERCWEKEGKGRRETLNHVVIYKRKVHPFPEVVFVSIIGRRQGDFKTAHS